MLNRNSVSKAVIQDKHDKTNLRLEFNFSNCSKKKI